MWVLFHRFFVLFFCAAVCAGICAPAQAQLATAPQSGIQLDRLEVLHNVPIGLSLTQVLSGQAGAFVDATDLQISHPHWYRSMWLRLHLKAAPNLATASDQAVLFFPKPYLDDLRLYTPGKQAGEPWGMQQAGDFVVPSMWPMRSLHPKFLLPSAERVAALEGQSMVLYLQVDHLAPVMLGVNLEDSKASLEEDALSLLIYGLGLGAILISALLTATLAWIHRDMLYAWYSVYAVAALVACASHAGIAHHILWPVPGTWAGTATLCFLMLSCVGQLQFTRCVNANDSARKSLRWVAHGVSIPCLLVAFCYPFLTHFWKHLYFASLTLFASTTLIAMFYMIRGWRSGNKLARVWLLAYVPLGITVVIALLEGVGIMPSNYWSYSLVILAVCLEVLILGLALQGFAHERHGERERQRALASTDPLTGFSSALEFQARLAGFWQQLRAHHHPGRDCAVAYVQLVNAGNTAPSEKMLARFVRVLRSGTRSQDWVGRINSNTMAIVIPDVGMTEDLDQRLARIIALGLMPDSTDPQSTVLQMRIAASTLQRFSGSTQELDAELEEMLARKNFWSKRPIRYLDDDYAQTKRFNTVDRASDLESVWNKALAAQEASVSVALIAPQSSVTSRH